GTNEPKIPARCRAQSRQTPRLLNRGKPPQILCPQRDPESGQAGSQGACRREGSELAGRNRLSRAVWKHPALAPLNPPRIVPSTSPRNGRPSFFAAFGRWV